MPKLRTSALIKHYTQNQIHDEQFLTIVCEISSKRNVSEAGLPLVIMYLLHKTEVKIKNSARVELLAVLALPRPQHHEE